MPEVGSFDFEVLNSGRSGRSSRFTVRCDAIGHHENEILLLSVIGPETSVKALTAGLRSSARDQRWLDYAVHLGDLDVAHLRKCPDGYHVHRAKLDYGMWHVLCLGKRQGFAPVLTEQTVWQLLCKEPFTTPLVRAWMPWLCQEMKKRKLLIDLTRHGCEAGLVAADSDALDALVSEGIKAGALRINGQAVKASIQGLKVPDLEAYMLRYGALLGKQAERSLEPLHVPGRDVLPRLDLLRQPFEAQAHVIEAVRKSLQRQKATLLVGEMGTGKTIMGLAAVHVDAGNRPYRGLAFCPGQLVNKWEREIRETIPDTRIRHIESWKDLLHLDRLTRPTAVEWYIIARDRAKLGAKWQPAYVRRTHGDDGFLRCPQCGLRLVDEKRQPLTLGQPGAEGRHGTGLWQRRMRCEWVLTNDQGSTLTEGCGSPLWQMNGKVWRYEPALYIKRHLRYFFDYLILDEVHEEKGADTAQGNAAGALASSCRKVIALTGTLIGGYAEHLRPLLFRLAPRSLVHEGLGWSNVTAFNERYGRIETRISVRSGSSGDDDNRMSRGSKSTTKSLRPGIMPALFGKHLIDKSVFLGLGEVAANLPPLEEECLPVAMDRELAAAYKEQVERPLAEAIKDMMRRRDRRLLGAMLQTLLAYPDYPYEWGPIGYWRLESKGNRGDYVTVTEPPTLPGGTIRPKEQTLLDLIAFEKAQGRKVWVYVQFTDRHDVQGRVHRILTDNGLKVGVLQASVPLARREDWIARNAPGLDVVVSHPRLVETGLDLFDKGGRHNFPTICFYETGYNLFTLRQASRRSWRIGQKEKCRVVYLYYQETMQERAMALMGKKLTAAQALEGRFSSEGLVALAGEDTNVEMALARSLMERMDDGDIRRAWRKADLGTNTPAPLSPNPTQRRRKRALCVSTGWLFD